MIKGPGKEVVGVVVYTCYADGTVDFTQDAPRKDKFEALKKCFAKISQHALFNIKNEAKCPFSPRNPQEYRFEQGGKVVNASADVET